MIHPSWIKPYPSSRQCHKIYYLGRIHYCHLAEGHICYSAVFGQMVDLKLSAKNLYFSNTEKVVYLLWNSSEPVLSFALQTSSCPSVVMDAIFLYISNFAVGSEM